MNNKGPRVSWRPLALPILLAGMILPDVPLNAQNPVRVMVTPSRATVRVGGVQQFRAIVANAADGSVKWFVNGVAGGNAMVGTISATGLYTAPGRAPSGAITVKAVSNASASATDSAEVSLITPPVKVTLALPVRVPLSLGSTYQFKATVENTDNTAVKWLVAEIAGGNARVGTVSSTGLYTAPDKMPSERHLYVRAVSVADPEKNDAAIVSLRRVIVKVTPERGTIKTGDTQQFNATVENATNKQVKWVVNDVLGGNSSVGTISATGLYKAPANVPNPPHVRVKAISLADLEESDSAPFLIQTTPAVKVDVTPDRISMQLGGKQQFAAEVKNATNTAVKWFVNDVAGGNATLGVITATGLYTAPAAKPEGSSNLRIKAVSVANADASDSSVVLLQGVKVEITPQQVTLKTGATQQYKVTVTNAANKDAKWFVNDVAGGNTTLGTISSAGLYTAPAKAPTPATVRVKAVSVADPEESASAAATIQNQAGVEVTVSPDGAKVKTGATQQFSAKVVNNTDTSVKWFVNDVAGGNTTVGEISATGLYKAPAKAPTPAAVTIKAVSVADANASDSTTLTVEQTPLIIITLTPETVIVKPAETQQFTAAVANSSDKTVKWMVNDVAGGNDVFGTISSSGLYKAPATVPTPAAVTIKAVSAVSADASDTSQVTVGTPPPSVTSVTPNIIQPGAFTFTVRGIGFTANTRASFAGTDAAVTLVSPTELRVTGNTPTGKLGDMVLQIRGVAPAAPPMLVEVRSYTGDPKVSLRDAHRFLRQATFGPTPETIDRLQAIGIDAWLNEQLAASTAGAYPTSLDMEGSLEPLQERLMRLAVTWPDQLKIKTAWILSQIFVVSGVEVSRSEPMVSYQRMLYDNAFTNFLTILRNVALHPAMGEYLDNVNNGKADPTRGVVPNENFGREALQLFTIGLQKLNANGTPIIGAGGAPEPTYDQRVVVDMARTLTGWTYNDGRAGQPTSFRSENYSGPMEPVESRHDTGEKFLLDGFRVPPNQTAEQDLTMALNLMFNHPNVGPFIGRQLIQHFVTSNPSPEYIARVTAAFNGTGGGARGDLRAVIRAILTDTEASSTLPNFGHMREPVAYMAAQLRPLRPTISDYPFTTDIAVEMGQRIFYSPSVFNYYSPNFRPAGVNLFGPEFQLFNTATALVRANFSSEMLAEGFYGSIKLDLSPYLQAAPDADFLVELIDRNIMGQAMSAAMKTAIADAVRQLPAASSRLRVQLALYLTFTSPQYQVEH